MAAQAWWVVISVVNSTWSFLWSNQDLTSIRRLFCEVGWYGGWSDAFLESSPRCVSRRGLLRWPRSRYGIGQNQAKTTRGLAESSETPRAYRWAYR